MSPIVNAVVDWTSGAPRSRQFGDIYFSGAGGLAEKQAVFLRGCGLPEGWNGRRRFVVAELGFGTGLSIAALLNLWRRHGSDAGFLSLFSIESEPLAVDEARRALSAWPEIGPAAEALLDRWPGRARGFHRVDLPGWRASLDVAVMDVAEALAAWNGAADAWFLDGFAPARNPAMWSPAVMTAIAAHSAPGARLASYSAAGPVRAALTEAGFAVTRQPGFGTKRHRLEAAWPGRARPEPRRQSIAILGSGVAGGHLKRAFAEAGAETVLIGGPASPASEGPAAIIAPRLDAGLAGPAALFAQAFARAVATCPPEAVLERGAVQLALADHDPRRFAAIAGSDLFEPGCLRVLSANEASERLGEPAAVGLLMRMALTVDPAVLLQAPDLQAEIAAVERAGEVWRLFEAEGALLLEVDHLVIAAGVGTARFAPELPLQPVRGQASIAPGISGPGTVLFGGYAAPGRGGLVFGATHDRDDASFDVRDGDHRRNLDTLAKALPALAARIDPGRLAARVGVRATTPDFLPIAGLSDGASFLTGLGSRGFTLAPLLAEHVAALTLGLPSPLPRSLAALVEPGRFAARRRRRGLPG